ncbi:MAG: FAD-dependent oxidoreductase [Coriobacteriales bacterium]|jgi:NADPH-dependent 2,4-dienoyl-CoA reductase/sulfur reductase-like enzyme/rhodanese-related sulfurtransferase|nr:FAD-dependent oxidoreductase [Coriobacteriales bacterium]
MTRILIVGGVAGGATAAARLRRLDEHAEIVIFERGSAVSFANCGLPYHIGGVIEKRDSLLLQSKEGFWARYRVEVRLHQEVTAIDRENHTLQVHDLENDTVYEDHYDFLILAPGARPRLPEADPEAKELIHSLHTLEDMDAIIADIARRNAQKVAVMGGGYVALEAAENLVKAGIRTLLVQRSEKLLPPFDAEMLAPLYNELGSNGIPLLLDTPITRISRQAEGLLLTQNNGKLIDCDLLIAAIGVSPASELARAAGLTLGERGGIVVDEQMRTSDAAIFAVGDAVEVSEYVTQTPAQIALAGPANKQARVAADAICGLPSAYGGTQGSAIIKVFKLTAAATGINEKTAKSRGLNYDKVYLFASNHAGYYPLAEDMVIKVLFEKPSGRILGAQLIGKEGTDKRADILAVAIRARMTAADLVKLELCYAPPFSSAKDPVNMVGLMISNLLEGRVSQFHWHEVEDLPRDGSVQLVDVRTSWEYASGHIQDFINIPVDELRARLEELDPTKPVYIHCHSGLRSYIAARVLAQKGFTVSHLAGGIRFYRQARATHN